MPYEIIKSNAGNKNGYRVRHKDTNVYFSSKAIPLKEAKKQRSALVISDLKPNHEIIHNFEEGILHTPYKWQGLHVPGKPQDFGDVIVGILEPGERIISVENEKKLQKLIRKGKVPNLPMFN